MTKIDLKKEIKRQLIVRVQDELEIAQQVLKSTSSFKHESDMKQESKYDTRSIEAGYLAGAQAKRVEELKLEIQQLEEIPLRDYKLTDEIALGALIELDLNNRTKLYYLSSTAGGTMVTIGGLEILIISVFSPIGNEVLGLKVGDQFELETKSDTRIYLIKSIA